jgi:hypothetical protein
MRIGLVSCVKSKLGRPAAARELYTSALFRGARHFVERSCDRWFIVSAEHGLVDPAQILAPYEQSLTTASQAARREWSRRVLGQLDEQFGPDVSSHVFEIHAGAAYASFGLVDGLVARGARVELPLQGLGLGRRLQFYKEAGCL